MAGFVDRPERQGLRPADGAKPCRPEEPAKTAFQPEAEQRLCQPVDDPGAPAHRGRTMSVRSPVHGRPRRARKKWRKMTAQRPAQSSVRNQRADQTETNTRNYRQIVRLTLPRYTAHDNKNGHAAMMGRPVIPRLSRQQSFDGAPPPRLAWRPVRSADSRSLPAARTIPPRDPSAPPRQP